MTDATTPAPSGRRYGGRTLEERRAARRGRFAAAALELFATRGYASTTIEALCAEAGLAARYFYEEFGDREALLRAVYDEVIVHVDATMEARLAAAPLELEPRVRAGLEALADAMVADERRARIAYAEVTGASAALERHRLDVVRAAAARQTHQFELLAGAGEIPGRDFRMVSMALVGAANQLVQDWIARPAPEREPIAEVVDTLAGLYVAALRPL